MCWKQKKESVKFKITELAKKFKKQCEKHMIINVENRNFHLRYAQTV